MKIITFSLVLAFLTFPVFSQSASTNRFRTLGDSMGNTISSSNTKLENYDRSMIDSGNTRAYASYRQKYETLSKALQESEFRLNRLIEFNDRTANIKTERDNYARLIKRLEGVKSEYDEWLRSVQ
jgi:hypothetical protein